MCLSLLFRLKAMRGGEMFTGKEALPCSSMLRLSLV